MGVAQNEEPSAGRERREARRDGFRGTLGRRRNAVQAQRRGEGGEVKPPPADDRRRGAQRRAPTLGGEARAERLRGRPVTARHFPDGPCVRRRRLGTSTRHRRVISPIGTTSSRRARVSTPGPRQAERLVDVREGPRLEHEARPGRPAQRSRDADALGIAFEPLPPYVACDAFGLRGELLARIRMWN